MDAATLTIFNHLFASVAEEMGVTLGRAAYSPNIKERLDYSCAVFLGGGRPALLAQAAHIPVHLGAMPASVRAAVARCAPLRPGDVVILNDPYQGGNHLPDITLVSPVFVGGAGEQGSGGAGVEEAMSGGAQKFSTNRPRRYVTGNSLHEFGKIRTLPFETQIQRGAIRTNESLVEMP